MKFRPFEVKIRSTKGIQIGDPIFSREKPYFYRTLKIVDDTTLLAGKWRLRDRFFYRLKQILEK